MCTESFWTHGCVTASANERGVGKIWHRFVRSRHPGSGFFLGQTPQPHHSGEKSILVLWAYRGFQFRADENLPMEDSAEAPRLSVKVAPSSRTRRCSKPSTRSLEPTVPWPGHGQLPSFCLIVVGGSPLPTLWMPRRGESLR